MTLATRKIPQPPPGPRLSVPRRGHVLSSAAEVFGEPIRAAVTTIAAGLRPHMAAFPAATARSATVGPPSVLLTRSAAEMAAWHLCTQWVLGVVLGALKDAGTLTEAATWFANDLTGSLAPVAAQLGSHTHKAALAQLRSIADPEALADLLPYVLDPHGPGSRLSVMRDPTTRATREKKRSSGVFYTPADVADHMMRLALNHAPLSHPLTVFDPACGTGVFLRSALAALGARHPTADPLTLAEQSLFGVDIDPWAVDATAYVLLHDALARQPLGRRKPISLWRLLRGNLAVADALSIDPAHAGDDAAPGPDGHRQRRQPLRHEIKARIAINDLFPKMLRGPRIIIGNPPYAPIGLRPDLINLGTIFETLRPVAPTSDIHPLFIEQMVRLAAPETSGALVVPLSISFNSRPQYTAARGLVGRTAGAWRFSFFDREPHALFGEDVKTRNTIVSWSRQDSASRAQIMTGPLLKWRGDTRARLFESIHFTEITTPIGNGIPKLSGALQSETFTRLQSKGSRLADLFLSISGSELTDTFQANASTVFVGSTAYNFINAFLKPPANLRPSGRASSNTVHAIRCASPGDAHLVYAILSSRVTFWLWHVIGDGFHVSRTFLEDLPIGAASFDNRTGNQLAELGQQLWVQLRSTPLSSNNRGRTSVAFPATRARDQQQEIDNLIIGALGLTSSFANNLSVFINSVVAAAPCGSFETSLHEEFA